MRLRNRTSRRNSRSILKITTVNCVAGEQAKKRRTSRLSLQRSSMKAPAGDVWRGAFMEDLWRDLRYTVRTMRKSPMFVLFVVLTLALGIGANTTVFTVINTLILHPLPVPDSSEVAAVGMAKTESTKSSAPLPMSHAELKDYQALNGVFRSLAGYTSPRGVTWQTSAASQAMFSELVTGNYFSTLGLSPVRGRFFLSEEDS